ncbi:MAG TPA: hypothetical protein VG204_07635 [Terriglobia bacterium]|nr:hypothetical protein [Terriglobia bacterium]
MEMDRGEARERESAQPDVPSRTPSAGREPDAIYQDGQVVGRVTGAVVNLDAGEIRFAELSNSDELLLPDECEFQKYTIIVQRIAHATKVDHGALHKGRVLRDVVAEILGYREQ